MGRIDKRLQSWLDGPPQDAPVNQVEALLDRYFHGRYEKKSGSHITVSHEKLLGHDGFGPLGDFVVPVKSGKRVKRRYLRIIAIAVAIIKKVDNDE